MNHTLRPLAILMISSLCLQCVTPQSATSVSLGSMQVRISCAYVEKSRRFNETEAECIMINDAATPARLVFKKISLEDPHAEIEPIDVKKIKAAEDHVDDVVMILGVLIIVGGIIAILSKSKANYSIRVPVNHFGWYEPSIRPMKMPEISQKTVDTDTFEIPGYRTIRFVFLAKHGTTMPQHLELRLGNTPDQIFKVPIKTPPGWSRTRSDW